jgi:hypothetical protein
VPLLSAWRSHRRPAQSESTITVDTTSMAVDFDGAQQVTDLPGPDGRTSLREATIASTNTAGPETIAFDIPTAELTGDEFVLQYVPATRADELTVGDDGTTIDATTQPTGHPIVVEGSPAAVDEFFHGLLIDASGSAVIGLDVRLYGVGLGIRGSGNTVTGSSFSDSLDGVNATSDGHVLTDNESVDNGRTGIDLFASSDASNNNVVVTGNTIARNGTVGLHHEGMNGTFTNNAISGNGENGMELFGTGTVSGNSITGNVSGGVTLFEFSGSPTTRYTISRNSISENGGLGIDLAPFFGVSKNDGQDKDGGANDMLNFPEFKHATDNGTTTEVDGRVPTPNPESITIEIFVNDAPDPSGHGEGETFVTTATPDAKGRFTASLPGGLVGRFLTATSTDPAGNTSGLSEAIEVRTGK